jgi:8-oxo-dGTP pyrophosphatase MutT (NUDIX family)
MGTNGDVRRVVFGLMSGAVRRTLPERAGVIVVRDAQLAVIERIRGGRKYLVVPGGSIKPDETPAEAALREAQEELGVPIDLGPLRMRVDYREEDDSIQRHWYFEATVLSDEIRVVGPETAYPPELGTFRAIWLTLGTADADAVIPQCVARAATLNRGLWPDTLIEIAES